MRVEQPSERLLEYFTRVFVLCQVVRAIFCGGKLPAKVQSFICPSGTSRTPSPTVGQSTSHVFCICSGKFPAESGTPALLGVCGLAAHNKMLCRERPRPFRGLVADAATIFRKAFGAPSWGAVAEGDGGVIPQAGPENARYFLTAATRGLHIKSRSAYYSRRPKSAKPMESHYASSGLTAAASSSFLASASARSLPLVVK